MKAEGHSLQKEEHAKHNMHGVLQELWKFRNAGVTKAWRRAEADEEGVILDMFFLAHLAFIWKH